MDTEKVKEDMNSEIENYIQKKDKAAYLLNDFLIELKKMNESRMPLKEQIKIINKSLDSKISKYKLVGFLNKNKIRKITKRTAIKKRNENEKDKK
ncbi:MAG: hypothetical protein ACYCSQ_06675 [bacterium]